MSCRGLDLPPRSLWTPSPFALRVLQEEGDLFPFGPHAIHTSEALVATRSSDRVEREGFLESCYISRRVLAPAPSPLTHGCLRDAVLIPVPSLSILGVSKNERGRAQTRSPYSIQTVRRPLRWSQKSPVPRSERKLTVGDRLRPQALQCSREAPGDAQHFWGAGQPAEREGWQEKQDGRKSRTTFPA